MGIINTNLVLGGSLANAARGMGNSASQLREYWLQMNEANLSNADWQTWVGVSSTHRAAVQDVIGGLIRVTQNSAGESLAGLGLWARVAESLGVVLPIVAQSTTATGKAITQLLLSYGTQISSVMMHDLVMEKLLADGNRATITAIYGATETDTVYPGTPDIDALKAWTATSRAVLGNYAGTEQAGGDQHIYKLVYGG